jgi:ribosomal protein L37AE/L43A
MGVLMKALAAFSLRQLQDCKTLLELFTGSVADVVSILDKAIDEASPTANHKHRTIKINTIPCPKCQGVMIQENKKIDRIVEAIWHCRDCQYSQYAGRVR